MSAPKDRAFAHWLRAQMRARKISQRQLALRSGVDHSTICRLVQGDRTPTFGTATKLARGLRAFGDEGDAAGYLGIMAGRSGHPTARVESAIRADDVLGEYEVQQVMRYYEALRSRRMAVHL
jgi:transcriptional regulator with XRE-family HTH domain